MTDLYARMQNVIAFLSDHHIFYHINRCSSLFHARSFRIFLKEGKNINIKKTIKKSLNY